jgi:4-amino-4-deoxy-L-arabinose transferase-like glycosyltransferase
MTANEQQPQARGVQRWHWRATYILSSLLLLLAGLLPNWVHGWPPAIPVWLVVTVATALWWGTSQKVARRLGVKPRLLVSGGLAAVLTGPMLWRMFLGGEATLPDFFLGLAWAACSVDFVWQRRPKWFAEVGAWRLLALLNLLASLVWATLIRLDLVPELHLAANAVLALGWLCVLRWLPELPETVIRPSADDSSSNRSHGDRWQLAWLIATGVVILWGSWVRISGVDTFAFQGDEYFHLNTAQGYLQTGEYLQWDFLHHEPQLDKPYERAWPYTWQVAQSIRWLGVSEFSARLPALVWGIGLLLLLPLLARIVTRSWLPAFVATALVAFDPTFIWLSTFSRMYTMLAVAALLAVAVFFFAVREPRQAPTVPAWQRWLALAAAFGLAGAAGFFIHKVAYLLVAGFGTALVVHAVRPPRPRWAWQALVALAAVGVVALSVFVWKPFFQLSFFTIRTLPAWEYPYYFISALVVPAIGAALLTSLVYRRWTDWPAWVLAAVAMLLPSLVYFVFFANRYSAKKYSALLIPLAGLLLAAVWQRWLQRFLPAGAWQVFAGSAAFLWLLVPLSIPYWEDPLLLKPDRTTLSYREIGFHDYPTVYGHIEQKAAPGEAVVLMGTKQYYLHRTDLVYYSTTKLDPMTREELQAIQSSHAHGWVVLSIEKKGELPRRFRRYVEKNLREVKKLTPTNFRVYRW